MITMDGWLPTGPSIRSNGANTRAGPTRRPSRWDGLNMGSLRTGREGDILAQHGWALLHSPSMGIAAVTASDLKPLTKAAARVPVRLLLRPREAGTGQQVFLGTGSGTDSA